MARDDFPAAVVRELELLAGTRCAAPFCRQDTTAASEDGALIRIGVAAHISSASPGGARYDPTMSAADRASSNNGLWMCQDHARQIDVDEARYPSALLSEWKRLAERRALADASAPQGELPDFGRSIQVTPEGLAQEVAAWSNDIGLAEAWGSRSAQGVEALGAEILLNAVEHADPPVQVADLFSRGRQVSLVIASAGFGPDEWLDQPVGGGGRTVLDLVLNELESSIKVSFAYRGGQNIWSFAFDDWPDDGCNWDVRIRPSEDDLALLSTCAVVRLRLGEATVMMSAPTRLLDLLAEAGVSRVVVTDVGAQHFLAGALAKAADARGVDLRFLDAQ